MKNNSDKGIIPDSTHHIRLNNNNDINSKPYPIPFIFYNKMKEETDRLLRKDYIRKSNSHIVSPCFSKREKEWSN
ncbi:hypothetical protein GVAV_001301 [Gurleya vavrai]